MLIFVQQTAARLSPSAKGDTMKKKTALKLDRETIRQLSPTDFGHVAGGTDVSQGTVCRTYCAPCVGHPTGPKQE
jgi:hypothetical protein